MSPGTRVPLRSNSAMLAWIDDHRTIWFLLGAIAGFVSVTLNLSRQFTTASSLATASIPILMATALLLRGLRMRWIWQALLASGALIVVAAMVIAIAPPWKPAFVAFSLVALLPYLYVAWRTRLFSFVRDP